MPRSSYWTSVTCSSQASVVHPKTVCVAPGPPCRKTITGFDGFAPRIVAKWSTPAALSQVTASIGRAASRRARAFPLRSRGRRSVVPMMLLTTHAPSVAADCRGLDATACAMLIRAVANASTLQSRLLVHRPRGTASSPRRGCARRPPGVELRCRRRRGIAVGRRRCAIRGTPRPRPRTPGIENGEDRDDLGCSAGEQRSGARSAVTWTASRRAT